MVLLGRFYISTQNVIFSYGRIKGKMHVESNDLESSGSSHELQDGSGFYSNLTGRWWWSNDDDEEEEADESTWGDWIATWGEAMVISLATKLLRKSK